MDRQKLTSNSRFIIWGMLGGFLAALLISLSFDVVITQTDMDNALAEVRTDSLAAFCADEALEAWRADEGDPAELGGAKNRENRENLAEVYAEKMPGAGGLVSRIAVECSDLIQSNVESLV